jgi:DMSO/TMAO reductase YedYZ molybdopterin-dependent catalytic subunit
MTGVITDVVDRNTFQSCSATTCHQAAWTDDKAQQWVGTPLWLLAGRMDDDIRHDGPAFNQALADAGYLLQIIATDGYSTTLDIAQVKRNNDILVAYQVNQNPLPDKYFPLRLVGNAVQKDQMVGAIAEIRMIFDAALATQVAQSVAPTAAPVTAEPAAAPEVGEGELAVFGLVEQSLVFNEADLRNMKVVQITAEHPKQGQQDYEGVPLNSLLSLTKVKPGATKLILTASDGYSAEVELSLVEACMDCLVAFTDTPGKFNLVMPDMESSLWVKELMMIEVQ